MVFKPRGYQKEILKKVRDHSRNGFNSIIELDCGAGKRFLQHEIVKNVFPHQKIIMIMQASTSLYETFRFFRESYGFDEVNLIDSRKPSSYRQHILKTSRVVITLPQTLYNTVAKHPTLLQEFDVCVINEIDQIVRRTALGSAIKQPYGKLLPLLNEAIIIGMSGTLRDDHYVLDVNQLKIKQELESLQEHIPKSKLVSMEDLEHTDFQKYVSTTNLILSGVVDEAIIALTMELESHIEELKNEILNDLEDSKLKERAKRDIQLLLSGTLNVDEAKQKKFSQGYLVRKYLWALPGEEAKIHLFRFGLDAVWVRKTIRQMPAKFRAVERIVEQSGKTVVLCSFLATCDFLEQMFKANGLKTVKITGKVNQTKRDQYLQEFRENKEKMIAIISNVGERDLDLPEAESLIIFDVIRTTKTVYQKLKRIRGGKCHILYYEGTSEEKKVKQVANKILERYPWSIRIESHENL